MRVAKGGFSAEPRRVHGKLRTKGVGARNYGLAQSQWKTSRTDDSIENQLRRANVCVSGKPRAVYEARFEFSSDGTAYRLKDAGYRIESLLTT